MVTAPLNTRHNDKITTKDPQPDVVYLQPPVCFFAHDACIRTNCRAIAMMFVCLSVWDGRVL